MGNEAWLAIIISLAMAVGFFFIGFCVGRSIGRAEGAIKKSEPLKKREKGEIENGAGN